jgi:hypothetical protein
MDNFFSVSTADPNAAADERSMSTERGAERQPSKGRGGRDRHTQKWEITMETNREAAAVAVARAHIEAWSHHDFETARAALAADVKVRALTTQNLMKGETNLRGVEPYMEGLKVFAQAVERGSAKVISVTGDRHNALVVLTVKASFGPGAPAVTMPMARLYLVDDEEKITSEQVLFYAAEG